MQNHCDLCYEINDEHCKRWKRGFDKQRAGMFIINLCMYMVMTLLNQEFGVCICVIFMNIRADEYVFVVPNIRYHGSHEFILSRNVATWHPSSQQVKVRSDARALVAGLGHRETFGWKDPVVFPTVPVPRRRCLTLAGCWAGGCFSWAVATFQAWSCQPPKIQKTGW